MVRFIKIFIGVIVTLTVLAALGLVGAAWYVSTPEGQQKAKDIAIGALSDALKTKVRLDSISVELPQGNIGVYGFAIDDLRKTTMLSVDTVQVGVNIYRLAKREIVLTKAMLLGAEGVFYKEKADSAANFQFVIDRLKENVKSKDKTPKDKGAKKFVFVPELKSAALRRASVKWDVFSEDTLKDRKLDRNHIHIRHVNAEFELKGMIEENIGADKSNPERKPVFTHASVKKFSAEEANSGMKLLIGGIDYDFDADGKDPSSVTVSDVDYRYKDKILRAEQLLFTAMLPDLRQRQNIDVKATNIFFHNDNGKPRKNKIKPHRGAFDGGHLNVTANAKIHLDSVRKDSVYAVIKHLDAKDEVGGIDIDKFTARVFHTKRITEVSGLNLRMHKTRISIPRCRIAHEGKKVFFEDTKVKGFTILKDIHKAFAPKLLHFTTPLEFTTTIGGDINALRFKNVRVNSTDKRLRITAEGLMTDVTHGKALVIRFYNIHMRAERGIKEQLVKHFAKVVKLKMMRQLQTIGDISYRGAFAVKYKLIEFDGTLGTRFGDIKIDFFIEGNKKELHGNIAVDALDLGAIMNVKSLHIGKTTAHIVAVTSKKTPRSVYARKHHGRLPIGTLHADIKEAKYGIVKAKRISADIESDGVVAHGTADFINSLVDVTLDFDYKQTDSEQKLSAKPHIRLHKVTQEEKEEKKRKKEEKKLQKEKEKQKAQAERERAKAEKLKAKEEKKRLKEEKKRLKEEEKKRKKEEKLKAEKD